MVVVSKANALWVQALKSGSAVPAGDGVILASAIFGDGEAARRTPVIFAQPCDPDRMFLAACDSVWVPDRRSLQSGIGLRSNYSCGNGTVRCVVLCSCARWQWWHDRTLSQTLGDIAQVQAGMQQYQAQCRISYSGFYEYG
jgi:hypothetical protein